MAFSDLHYFVPDPAGGELELLKGISGVFRPGVLTALMGASGAGKTTLMDVLADRKTGGRTTGTVKVNGYDKVASTFARVSGYCEQFDTHAPGTSVEEAVRISATLRLGRKVPQEQQDAFVRNVMDIVELDPIAGAIVGLPGMYGLSGEQFKRLTIAVELAANPACIFLDEPTSGLDARAAQIVMRVVRNIVNSNRTIVCTIHQPSAEIFLAFDELLLLKRGGSTIYSGPLGEESRHLIDYFAAVPGGKALKPHSNPATWMLEVSTQSEEERLGIDFAERYRREQDPGVQALIEPHLVPVEGEEQVTFDDEYATGTFTQYKVLLDRQVKSYWRNPPYNTTRLALTVISALILGSFYWSVGDNYSTAGDVTNVMGALFISVMFLGLVNFQLVIPCFIFERPTFYRERAARMYSVLPWVSAFEDVEIPWVTAQAVIFSIITYFMIHFEYDAGKFFFYLLNIWLGTLIYTYLGMLMVAITPSLIMGITLGATMLGLWFLFAGFMIPKPDMPHWWQWFYYICPPSWSIYALAADQLGDKGEGYPLELVTGEITTVSQYIEDSFDYKHNLRWMAVGIIAAMVLFMRFALVLTVKYVNFQNR